MKILWNFWCEFIVNNEAVPILRYSDHSGHVGCCGDMIIIQAFQSGLPSKTMEKMHPITFYHGNSCFIIQAYVSMRLHCFLFGVLISWVFL